MLLTMLVLLSLLLVLLSALLELAMVEWPLC
jgi:hypothetical protein